MIHDTWYHDKREALLHQKGGFGVRRAGETNLTKFHVFFHEPSSPYPVLGLKQSIDDNSPFLCEMQPFSNIFLV